MCKRQLKINFIHNIVNKIQIIMHRNNIELKKNMQKII